MNFSTPPPSGNAFDREYRLDELLTRSDLDMLLAGVAKTHALTFRLRNVNGSLVYTAGIEDPNEPGNGKAVNSARWILRYELEEIGDLEMVWLGTQNDARFRDIGKTVALVCEWMIRIRHGQTMTAHLHLEVVEEQYRRLQEKTEALEISEKRYRELAESLEVEVRKKTREVRDIQARLMQQSHLAAIGRLAAGIAHEINNPMGFITSNLAILSQYISELTPFLKQQQTVLSNLSGGRISRDNALSVLEAAARTSKDVDFGFIADDVPALISESREGAERIRLIVKNLRLFAQPGITDRTLVDLNRSLDATLEVLRGWIGEKVTIVRCFGDLKKISCHETQMNQALMNLILNALQAVGDSGEIRITTACEDGYVLVRIQDSGPGIPEENLASVFEPFFTTREVGEGCGLGLTVAYNIIRKYEGEIDIASSPGSGTEVWVRMPVV